ncbi:MAG: GAF domain-containing protein, partial [Angelakisella sp.]
MKQVSIGRLLDIGIALSKEKNRDNLLEVILTTAMDITNCDGGTLYIINGNALDFKLMITKSLGILKGGERYGPIDLPPVPLSRQHVCARAALDGSLINSAAHSSDAAMNSSGARSYDAIIGYHTASMLVVPMEDDKGHVIGVLQLLNALDDHGTAVVFPQECEQVIRALASQAAISLTNMNYAAEVQELLDSFVRVISTAIDARTPYNANHTRGMVRVGSQFIEWLNSSNGDWQFTPEKKRLFLMSVWFHDIGKLTVPLEIMDKASRLGQQVPAVGYRFQVISLLNKIALMEGRITQEQYQQCDRDLADADSLIREANQVYQQSTDQAKRIAQLGKRTYLDEQGNEQPWLTAAELASLSIPRGTLSPEERAAMQNHVVMTSRMLQEMKFPPEYDCVPEWAG